MKEILTALKINEKSKPQIFKFQNKKDRDNFEAEIKKKYPEVKIIHTINGGKTK